MEKQSQFTNKKSLFDKNINVPDLPGVYKFYNSEKKEIEFDFGDEIISSSVLVFDGKILNERFKER